MGSFLIVFQPLKRCEKRPLGNFIRIASRRTMSRHPPADRLLKSTHNLAKCRSPPIVRQIKASRCSGSRFMNERAFIGMAANKNLLPEDLRPHSGYNDCRASCRVPRMCLLDPKQKDWNLKTIHTEHPSTDWAEFLISLWLSKTSYSDLICRHPCPL